MVLFLFYPKTYAKNLTREVIAILWISKRLEKVKPSTMPGSQINSH